MSRRNGQPSVLGPWLVVVFCLGMSTLGNAEHALIAHAASMSPRVAVALSTVPPITCLFALHLYLSGDESRSPVDLFGIGVVFTCSFAVSAVTLWKIGTDIGMSPVLAVGFPACLDTLAILAARRAEHIRHPRQAEGNSYETPPTRSARRPRVADARPAVAVPPPVEVELPAATRPALTAGNDDAVRSIDSSPAAICRWIRAQVAAGRDLSEPGFTKAIAERFGVSTKTAENRKAEVRTGRDLRRESAG